MVQMGPLAQYSEAGIPFAHGLANKLVSEFHNSQNVGPVLTAIVLIAFTYFFYTVRRYPWTAQ